MIRAALRWLRDLRDPFDVDERMPDGPGTVWWWREFYRRFTERSRESRRKAL